MIEVKPVTKSIYLTQFQRNGFGAAAKAHVFLGVCPLCHKTVGGSGRFVMVSQDLTRILTSAEAHALPVDEVRGMPVGPACYKKLGPDYAWQPHPGGDVQGDYNLVELLKERQAARRSGR